jgi:hypothetical protein
MIIFSFSRGVDPVIAGLKEGKKCREKSFLPTPDSDPNDKDFYENAIQLGNAKIRQFAMFSPIFSSSHNASICVYDKADRDARARGRF